MSFADAAGWLSDGVLYKAVHESDADREIVQLSGERWTSFTAALDAAKEILKVSGEDLGSIRIVRA